MNLDDDFLSEWWKETKEKFLRYLSFDPVSKILTAIAMAVLAVWYVLREFYTIVWMDTLAMPATVLDILVLPIIVLDLIVCVRCFRRGRKYSGAGSLISIFMTAIMLLGFKVRGASGYALTSTILLIFGIVMICVQIKAEEHESSDK